MRILSLDLGDVHTGTAISDISGIIATPFKTVPTVSLENFLKEIIKEKEITTIVIGYPKTMKGNISQQTQKIIDSKNDFEKKFPSISWILWDERLTSKTAQKLKSAKDKEEKLKLHSIAAALILESYLEFIKFKQSDK